MGQLRNLLNVVGHSTRIEYPIHSEAYIERVPEVWFPLNQERPHGMGFLIDSVRKKKASQRIKSSKQVKSTVLLNLIITQIVLTINLIQDRGIGYDRRKVKISGNEH